VNGRARDDYNAAVDAHRQEVRRAAAVAAPVARGPLPIVVTLIALVVCLPGDWLHLNGVSALRAAGALRRRHGALASPLLALLRFAALACALCAAPFALARALLLAIGDALSAVGSRGEYRRFAAWPPLLANAAADALVDHAARLIIVPGYAENEFFGAITAKNEARLRLAAREYFAGGPAFILVSGGNVHPAGTLYNEAFEMRRYLVESLGVPPERVIVEPLAEHTPTNLRNAGRYMLTHGIEHAIVVSDENPFGQSIMLQAPHSLIFGVLTRTRLRYGHTLGRLTRIDDARTCFEPSPDVMLVRAGASEP
jgi:uncharacterized SAM-binding protein YcdF (DUF218 family)